MKDRSPQGNLLSIEALTWSRYPLLALACVVLVLFWIRIELIPQYRTDIAGAEYNVVYGVQKVMLGLPLYEDPELPPFDIVQYTPLYHWTCAAAGKLLGIDPMDPHRVFLLSRWLSLGFNVLTVLLVFLAVSRIVPRRYAVWAALLSFFAFSQHFFSRSDSLYALYFVATLYCFMRWSDVKAHRRTTWLVLAAVCAVFSLMAKQTGAFILTLIPLYLCIAGEWRALVRYTAATALMLGLSYLAIVTSVPFDLFLKNTVQGLMNGFSDRFLILLIQPHLYVFYAGWHLASIALFRAFWRERHPAFRFLAVALPVSLAFSFLTALKSGSDFNYFFENMVLAFMALAMYFGTRISTQAPNTRWQRVRIWIGAAVVIYGLAFAVHRTRMFRGWSLHHSDPAALMADYNADLQVRDILNNELALRAGEGIYITYRGHLEHLMIGRSMLTQKDIIEWSAVPPFDYSAFDRAMRDGTIRFVISEEPLDTLHVMGRSYPGYHPIRQVGTRFILARTPDR